MNLALRVLIIEDELLAAEKLERYLVRYSAEIQVKGQLDSVAKSIEWLEEFQPEIDLIFMDIQLTDGKSFEIFKKVKIIKPVIFITAYSEFALDAFKVNGIDYLLKPITFSDLSTSLQKLTQFSEQLRWDETKSAHVLNSLAINLSIKSRFMVKLGDHIKSITVDQISLFFADGRDVFLVTNQLRKFIIDYTLEGLEEVLDPHLFFRINRSYIVNINALQDVVVHSNSRLKITPNIKWDGEMVVSRDKVNEFKSWFDGVKP